MEYEDVTLEERPKTPEAKKDSGYSAHKDPIHFPAQQLRELMAHLSVEVEALKEGREEARIHVAGLAQAIASRLLEPNRPELQQAAVDKAKFAIEHFQADHPRATHLLNNILVTLSGMSGL